jgi:AmmeMemoRadiSam system protein B
MERECAVAGRFYPAEPARLAAEVSRHLADVDPAGAAPALGIVVPHAGYVYSGAIAGATYSRVQVPERAIVLCPNHTGLGRLAALWPDGGWVTPLGRVPVDPALADALAACPLVEPDRAAHRKEHALEVQLPFLLARRPDIAIAPLCLGPLDLAQCREVGAAVAAAARLGALVVASSDMNHYLPADETERRDRRALERLLALDPEGLYQTVRREHITMCGVVPATVMLYAARELGATRAQLVRYGHSGLVNGDLGAVVGYAGVIVA